MSQSIIALHPFQVLSLCLYAKNRLFQHQNNQIQLNEALLHAQFMPANFRGFELCQIKWKVSKLNYLYIFYFYLQLFASHFFEFTYTAQQLLTLIQKRQQNSHRTCLIDVYCSKYSSIMIKMEYLPSFYTCFQWKSLTKSFLWMCAVSIWVSWIKINLSLFQMGLHFICSCLLYLSKSENVDLSVPLDFVQYSSHIQFEFSKIVQRLVENQ